MAVTSVRRSQDPVFVGSAPGINVVAVAVLLGSFGIGGVLTLVLRNPIPLFVFLAIGLLLAPSPPSRT